MWKKYGWVSQFWMEKIQKNGKKSGCRCNLGLIWQNIPYLPGTFSWPPPPLNEDDVSIPDIPIVMQLHLLRQYFSLKHFLINQHCFSKIYVSWLFSWFFVCWFSFFLFYQIIFVWYENWYQSDSSCLRKQNWSIMHIFRANSKQPTPHILLRYLPSPKDLIPKSFPDPQPYQIIKNTLSLHSLYTNFFP